MIERHSQFCLLLHFELRPRQLLRLKFYRLHLQDAVMITHGHNGQKCSVSIMGTKKSKVRHFIETNAVLNLQLITISFRQLNIVKFGKDPRQYSTTTKEFVDDGKGNIKGVNTIQVEWTQSPTGQWSMKEVAGTEKYYPADLILLAMGFLGPEKTVPNELKLELDGRGNVKAVNGQYGTSRDGIFAAGGSYRMNSQ